MTHTVAQALLVTAGGVGLAALALGLTRRGLLGLRYTVGWLVVAAITIALALLSGLLRPLAAAFGITPTGMLLAAASAVLLLITLQLSVAVSGLRDDIQTLAEAQALLEERVVRLEEERERVST